MSDKRTLAMGTPGQRPAWLRVTNGERRWAVGAAMLVAIALHSVMPSQFVPHPAYVVPAIELALLIFLGFALPSSPTQKSPKLRVVAQLQFALIAVWNIASLTLLVRAVTTGAKITADDLLLGGMAIWLTNVIVFSLWYWSFDRGGPVARALGEMDIPDLLFPQMTDEHLARDWEPYYLDYFFVSFTNSTAFSPTDTMPLSRWIKVLFIVQSLTALITIGLVAARAVNILPGG
ncbi:hypothetical protein SAMN05892883_4292 [Jatrophihabitans sp. GAS493]|uniref:hypothetical protein n=1 Tax=Jatrophihabitans sp. GAS493 TaxID=1907575 RepID=UPI000BBF6D84|nr:hypothetical protein [Jatrophihabitans sp. GAS493]SOD75087.1 hypothetical protein SAMN05892883_4292 [Jatrophihabitans sp. GAS493]